TTTCSRRESPCLCSRPSQPWSIGRSQRASPPPHARPLPARARSAGPIIVDPLFMDHGLKIAVWNVRGLNSRARRSAIRSLLGTTSAPIVCLQETKMALIYSPIVLDILGSEFDDYTYLSADGTRGGILLALKSRVVTISDPLLPQNALTAKVFVASGTPGWLTMVYGPQDDADKILFLQELRDIRAACPGSWMLCGGFNLIYRAEDKNMGGLHRRMMGRFRRSINDPAIKEIYLNGRRFTWSNEQSPPTLVHLDRVLCTFDWEDAHGECHLRCLALVV
uniref:Endonuclease/exonuclease/phosphatase domain-containing protein n=1 Tax=Aegilops tauschii subsp. strangulata TaxID=200361 RepID=A0A452Y5M9_AEGTS